MMQTQNLGELRIKKNLKHDKMEISIQIDVQATHIVTLNISFAMKFNGV